MVVKLTKQGIEANDIDTISPIIVDNANVSTNLTVSFDKFMASSQVDHSAMNSHVVDFFVIELDDNSNSTTTPVSLSTMNTLDLFWENKSIVHSLNSNTTKFCFVWRLTDIYGFADFAIDNLQYIDSSAGNVDVFKNTSDTSMFTQIGSNSPNLPSPSLVNGSVGSGSTNGAFNLKENTTPLNTELVSIDGHYIYYEGSNNPSFDYTFLYTSIFDRVVVYGNILHNEVSFNSKKSLLQLQFSNLSPLSVNPSIPYVLTIHNNKIDDYDSIILNLVNDISYIDIHVFNVQNDLCRIAIVSHDTSNLFTDLLKFTFLINT